MAKFFSPPNVRDPLLNVVGGAASLAALQGQLFGGTMSNGTDAVNDINFAAVVCMDSTGVALISGAGLAGKQLDAAWAVGANAGGRMSAAAIANTTYHCFAIKKDADGSVDFGFDTSPTAPTMPAGYTYFRRIGSIVRAGATILAFTQNGDQFTYSAPRHDLTDSNNPGTASVTATLTVPTGIVVEAVVVFQITDLTPAVSTTGWLRPLISTDAIADNNNGNNYPKGSAGAAALPINGWSVNRVFTNTSAQVAYRLDNSTTDHYVNLVTYGWIDTRGRAA